MLRQDIALAVEKMPTGTHAVLVYDSQENKHDILFHHIKSGIRKDGLFYICAEETPEDVQQAMEVSGIDAGTLIENGLLAIQNYDEVYIQNGKVDPSRIIGRFEQTAQTCVSKGMKGVRGAGEMSCFFREGRVKDLIEYEKALGTSFSFPGKGICAYNLVEMGSSGNLEILWPIIKAHGMVIMTGPRGGFALETSKVSPKELESARVVSL